MGLIAEATEDLVPNSEPDAAPLVTLEDAQQLFDSGSAALRTDDFDTALDHLSRALEIRVQHYGELAPELTSTYHKYGCALLYKVQAETDVLGESATSKEKNSTSPKTAVDEGVAKGSDENSDAEGSEEELQEDEETDLELAWKMLDIARVIHEKQHTHTIAEVDVITALGDVSLEKEDFQTSFEDYTRALEILKGLVEPDDRHLAELNFKLALAQELGGKLQEAIENCLKAASVCKARLQRLKTEEDSLNTNKLQEEKEQSEQGHGANDNDIAANSEEHAQKVTRVAQEIKEIEQLLVDLREKVDDLREMESAPRLLEALQHSSPALEFVKQALFAAAAAKSIDGKAKVDGPSQTEPISNGFGEALHTSSSSNGNVTHLGVVGRGVKRTAPIAISTGSDPRAPEVQVPKRSFEQLIQGNGSGETQIGFNVNAGGSATVEVCEVVPSPICLDNEPPQGEKAD
ncbi:hypothetical protein O6H91_05G098000 [Diphasiastrum complanatum]|uniref:Uncharacterized protein n=1 Tax=Diphasiastrum complanatum TaxID=34168 RepID=A0ACC2DR68_DIPCM|nr:hypothetical protein O6H91_05G098000 [Diphasiastrum complanatum]